ncbi:MAG: hypothetical protein ACJAYX_003735 [Planctomycetota bacterium]|jgi:hypothetical protein
MQAVVRTTRSLLGHNPTAATPVQPARFTATPPAIPLETSPIDSLTAQVLVDRLATDLESGRRSNYSTETVTNSLDIDVFRIANSTQNDLGSISG